MYNFLDPKLSPKVSSSAPATDNYEASNLISENGAVRARGFLAYTVTRPPVALEFEFLCPISVSFIALETSVGRQKCTGIELFAKNSTTPFTSIARAVFDKSGLTVCDSKTYNKSKPPPCHTPDKELRYFKSDQRRLWGDTTCLKVVIFRTDRSVPCLGAIKVFGAPSGSCSKVTVETIGRIMGGSPEAPQTGGGQEGLKIPQDFVDDLTCEIMAIPMTLPSGKTVDRDTLDKHIESEKSFGRKPCDPFTGLKFTETRKPVINVALKSRIDMFLMQNSTNPAFFGLKRALGGQNLRADNKRAKYGGEKECCSCRCCQFLYKIPCQHYYCRNCLLQVVKLECNSCGLEFVKSDAVRCH
ncbi:U-box domain containing 5 [Tribolium castaneum]|uniref:RING finger protein 37-like Protein n=1 Tax=Tribolium castaneum TaxID=7070 RepID=A0A139W9X1_TRICA|nr:U-box domain containing 5 [Tribolium castaneum]KYB24712.1 RING finger protein 37-like Protein [Tribolium castaneum]|eukprot:NP_001159498.1 U-box domain containing 5 [Tribolium castaneum]